MLGNPRLRASLYFKRKPPVGNPKRFHSRLQPKRIQLIYAERPEAALRAPQPANQPLARLPRRIGQRRIHNLHEFGVTRRTLHQGKHSASGRRNVGWTQSS